MNRTGYVIFHEKGKAGLKDADGHVVLPAVYDKILDYDDDGFIRVLKGDVYGTVDLEGQEVIPHSIGLTHLGVFHQHTARAMKDGRWGLVDEKGNAVGAFDYALMGAHRKWGYTVTTLDGQQGIVNEKGVFTPSVQPHKPAPAPKPLYPDSYDIPPSFYKGFAVCHKQGKYGILKTDGTYLFPMVYTAINWNDFKKMDCWFAAVSMAYYHKILKYGLPKFVRFAENVWSVNPEGKSDKQVALAGLDALKAWMKEIGLPLTISELGATTDMLDGIAKGTFLLDAGYHQLTHDELMEVLSESM